MTPAELIVCDNKNQTYEEIFLRLKKSFCSNQEKQNCFCSSCRKIENFVHPNCILIDPKGSYSIKDIEIVFEKTAFSLNENEVFYFILLDVHNLNVACANKLLKVLEEPPIGYNFILSTNNASLVPATILSRCVINKVLGKNSELTNPILTLFYIEKYDSIKFESTLKESNISDEESADLLNSLYSYYVSLLTDIYKKPDYETQRKEVENLNEKILFIKHYMRYMPSSGSATLFWKNLYMLFPRSKNL